MASLNWLWLQKCSEYPDYVLSAMFFSTVSKITLLCSLESSFRNTWKPLPLLVKIIHKSRLRYYGKFGLKIDYPYQVSHSEFWATVTRYLQDLTAMFLLTLSLLMLQQNVVDLCFTHCSAIFQAYFEVADQSGIMSLVLWNELCPEFYQRLNVGTVLYIQNYTLKQSYSNRSHPQMDHHRMKTFTSIGM